MATADAPPAAAAAATQSPHLLRYENLEWEETMREFALSHPESINEKVTPHPRPASAGPPRRKQGPTLLTDAASEDVSPSFITWLLDMGADVNLCDGRGFSPLQAAGSVAVMDIFLTRGADPTWQDEYDRTALHHHSRRLNKDCVKRLLQFPPAIETINYQDYRYRTALFSACETIDWWDATADDHRAKRLQIIEMLLFSGADPTIKDEDERTPLDILHENHPDNHAAIALLELFLFMSPRGYYLTKARHILATHHALIATHRALTRAAPSYLQPRMPPLPRVDLVAPPPSQDQEGERDKEQVKTGMAVLRHVLDVDEDGTPKKGLLGELFLDLIELMGPERDFYFLEEEEEGEEEEEEGDDVGDEKEDEEEDGVKGSGDASRYSLRSSTKEVQA